MRNPDLSISCIGPLHDLIPSERFFSPCVFVFMGSPVVRDSNHAQEIPEVLDFISESGIHLLMLPSMVEFRKSDNRVSGLFEDSFWRIDLQIGGIPLESIDMCVISSLSLSTYCHRAKLFALFSEF